jgi:hypothetical protein
MIGWLKAEIMCMFAFLTWTAVAVVQGRSQGLGTWFLPVTLVAIFGTVVLYLVRIRRLGRASRAEG